MAGWQGQRTPRIGLVLGAGGILGAAWINGVLEGLRRATGFQVPDAALTVGTSAGAFIGAMLANGVPSAAIYGQCTGETDDSVHPKVQALVARIDREHNGPWLQRFPVSRRMPRPVLAGPRLAWRGLWQRGLLSPELVLAGLAGDGLFDARSLATLVRTSSESRIAPHSTYGWPRRPLWLVSCELEHGTRVVFGRDGPLVPLDVAVRASAAIPGVFAPQRIEGRRHVDGGVLSATNLDLMAGLDLDLVLVLSPLSGGHVHLPRSPGPWWQKVGVRLARRFRQRVDARLEAERKVVEASGIPVLVLHPEAAEIAAMPFHCMSLGQRGDVMRRAAEQTMRRLQQDPHWQEVRQMLEQAIWPREAWLRQA